MTQPTKPEPTQAERELVESLKADKCNWITPCMSPICEHKLLNALTSVRREAHAAGAAEMVERIPHTRECSFTGDSCLRCQLDREGPNPNYLAEIKAGVREECAEAVCSFCIYPDDYPLHKDVVDGWLHTLTWTENGERKTSTKRCIAHKIRSLDPNHSDVLEGMKREAVKPLLKIIDDWAEGGHVNGRYLTDEERKVMRQTRALLKEGE